MALRLTAIAGLFLFADAARPYANFFGDEELFKSRTVWLRNVGLGVPISPADMIYVFDEVGRSSYLYVLAYLQALTGDAPYGNNVLNAVVYIAAVALMFKFFRRVYGRVAALASAAVLLFLPSLFSWSISVLKEPLYILVAGLEVICAVQILCARTITRRLFAALGVAACAVALGSLRVGGTRTGRGRRADRRARLSADHSSEMAVGRVGGRTGNCRRGRVATARPGARHAHAWRHGVPPLGTRRHAGRQLSFARSALLRRL